MKVPLQFFILTIISFCLHFYCESQDIHIDLVTPPKDESWARIRGIVQDPQGFLWLAVDGGLYKYDGYKCVAYYNEPKNPNSLANNWVESIYGGKDSFLLLGTYGSGLDRFDLSTGNFTHYRYSDKDSTTLSNNIVTAIVKDKQGLFWIGTNDGLNRFDPQSGKFTRYKNNPNNPSSLSDNQVRVLFVDHDGILWVGTKSPWVHDGGTRVGGLNRFDPRTGKFTRYMHDPANPQSLIDNQITAIFEDSHGTFWVGTAGNGLHTMNRDKGIFERHLYDAAHPEKLSRPPVLKRDTSYITDYITFINEDNKGNIWIGTLNGGINVYDPLTQKVAYYGSEKNSKEKLEDNRFGTSYSSRDGIFWVASWNGNLYKVNPYKISLSYNHLDKGVSDFYKDSNGVLWIATEQGLLRQSSNGEIQQFLIDKKVSSVNNTITNIEGDSEHNLWLGTLGGLYHFNTVTQTFTVYHHEPGKETTLISDTVTSLTKAKSNTLWVGTVNGLELMDITSGAFKHYKYDPKDSTSLGGFGFSDEGIASVWSITISSDNTLWACVGGAINRFNERTGRFKKYVISDIVTFVIKEDREKNIWAGTNAGLFKYDRKSDEFTVFHDLSREIKRNTGIFDITEDRLNNLWLKTGDGFIKLDVEKKEASTYACNEHSFKWFNNKSYITHDGEILSGDASGYFAFYPDALLKNLPLPNIVITNFSLSNELADSGSDNVLSESIYQTKQIRLKHNQNIFSFGFASIDFTDSSENRNILFMLERYDKSWRKADAEQTANYYNVPPGSYTFRVKAANSNGIWAEKNISVIILPPWWTTWWAYCIFGLLFIAGVYIVHRIQKQRVIDAERGRARERELVQAKEIEKAYKELKSTQAQLIQKEKMASLGELTAGIAHEIQNPLNFVNNFSEINKELIGELRAEKDDPQIQEEIINDIEQNIDKILRHGKRADSIVKGMLQHSRANTGKQELTDINALIDECLRLSYHGLRAKEKEFKAEIKTDLDKSIGKINVVPQDISRVLLNIFNNSFYAIDEKKKSPQPPDRSGQGLKKSEEYEPTISVCTKKLDGKVEVHVKDNGNGIPQNIVDKIFQPFFTTKPSGEGTGLGLSLSYDIIKAHGGEIKVESKEGEGTEFLIELHS